MPYYQYYSRRLFSLKRYSYCNLEQENIAKYWMYGVVDKKNEGNFIYWFLTGEIFLPGNIWQYSFNCHSCKRMKKH